MHILYKKTYLKRIYHYTKKLLFLNIELSMQNGTKKFLGKFYLLYRKLKLNQLQKLQFEKRYFLFKKKNVTLPPQFSGSRSK